MQLNKQALILVLSREAKVLSAALALSVLIGGTGLCDQKAHAWKMPEMKMPPVKNPFKKTHDESLDKPPPGMTDVLDPTNDATDKTLAAPESEEEEKAREKNLEVAPVDDKFDPLGGDPDLHVKVAKRLIAKKQYKEALIELNEAVKLSKNNWEARYLGAYIYQLQGRNQEAITRYQQYIRYKPDNAQAHINLGVVLRKEGQIEEAEEEYREAINLHYFSLQAHYDLANLLIEKGNLEGALKELRACEKIAPTNAWVHNNLGVIYQRRNYLEEASDEFNRAANLEPANKTFSDNLAIVREQIYKKRSAKITAAPAVPKSKIAKATPVSGVRKQTRAPKSVAAKSTKLVNPMDLF